MKQAVQIHDYLSVSFFRQPAEVKAASQKIIKLFSDNYPETVSYKYFVNVPLVMQWMMGAMKALISKDTFQKMTWLTYGNTLHTYLGDDIPLAYGGKAAPLVEKGLTPKYDNEHTETKADEVDPISEEVPKKEEPVASTSQETPTSAEKSEDVSA